MSLMQGTTLAVPRTLLEFFPMTFVLRINDKRGLVQLQDHVGDK